MTDMKRIYTRDAVGSFILTIASVILFDLYGYIGWVFASTLFLGIVCFGVFLAAIGELSKT